MSTIYFIIFVLFVIYIVFLWNSTREFESLLMKFSFILIGTIFIAILTLILFWISKIGIQYPKKEMIGEVRKIVIFESIHINGFVILIKAARLFTKAKSGMV